MNQFSAGDLAIIICALAQENVGKCVRLVKCHGCGGFEFEGKEYEGDGYVIWEVETADGSPSLVRRNQYVEVKSRAAVCREGWLMPLRGDRNTMGVKAEDLCTQD